MTTNVGGVLRDTLTDVFRLRGIKEYRGDHVGLEFEVEFKQSSDFNMPNVSRYWTVKHDDSLRNIGMEYVTNIPSSTLKASEGLTSLMQTLDRFKEHLADPSATRSGFHVHCNMLDRTWPEIMTIACSYWLIESCVSHLTGPLREGSMWCVRLVDAKSQTDPFIQLLSSIGTGVAAWSDYFYANSIKYASLNLATLLTFGTLEFRSMSGQFDNSKLQAWLQMTTNLCYKNKFKYPHELMDWYLNNMNEMEPIDMIKHLIGDNKYILDATAKKYDSEQLRANMLESAKLLAKLCYFFEDKKEWDKVNARVTTKLKPKDKVLIGADPVIGELIIEAARTRGQR